MTPTETRIPNAATKPNPNSGHLAWYAAVAACIKLFLIPSYHSTDFEVHRHWLALTHSLPLSHWYSDHTSPWTLDYPPFFAHFERFLSLFARLLLDPTILHLHDGLDNSSPSLIVFHRLTVILADSVLVYGIHRLGKKLRSRERNLMWVLVVWNPGLLIVDHMHFQYNGFLLGLLLLSLSWLEDGKDLMGGFAFAVLLCFKHLFAVAAPVYFVYLLRHYCRGGLVRGFGRLVMMGTVVVAVFVAAYGPFVYYGQIQQVLGRMFPFGRGLCHAYWAPNFWVFYILLDKGLAFVLLKLGFIIQAPTASFTGGLVGYSSPFAVLPTVTPLITFVLVLLSLVPCLVKAWRDPQPRMITRWVAYAYTCGFLFGWHVHEKASLHFVIPLAIVAIQSMEDASHYFLLSIVLGLEGLVTFCCCPTNLPLVQLLSSTSMPSTFSMRFLAEGGGERQWKVLVCGAAGVVRIKDVANIGGWPENTVAVKEKGKKHKGCDVEVLVESTQSSMSFLGSCLVGRLEEGVTDLPAAMEIQRRAQRNWKVTAGVQASELGGACFLFTLPLVEDAQGVLRARWSFGDRRVELEWWLPTGCCVK
ncbi:hypothetical protein RHMOL_Rhmol01G0202600 [Rhododendron molle]|uniref:Uncharacterized protein n=1 Tax=Rhododendron molle TaxID=49168 RepID=A0ACC0Q358_RHOML|nr:hypothetical protein RHMOL_Rhmol01G0202600 [Rhododendron molle]